MPNGSEARIRRRELEALITHPREDLHIEIKEWLDLRQREDQANLAQAILALANHGRGYIVIGFEESGQDFVPAENRPDSLDDYGYTPDRVNGIVQRFADPPFQCETYSVRHPTTGDTFPVIVVPGGHTVPIRAVRSGPNENHVKKDTYYIRRPGPQSAPPQSAREWDALIRRCVLAGREQLIEDMRVLLSAREFTISEEAEVESGQRAQDDLQAWITESRSRLEELVSQRYGEEKNPYRLGTYTVAYLVEGDFESLPPARLRDALARVEGHETGLPAWWLPSRGPIAPRFCADAVEVWLGEDPVHGDPGHLDYWRASPEGKLVLVRDYEEDGSIRGLERGTAIAIELPIWRTGECLLHAQRFAAEIGQASAWVIFQVTWSGLNGRRLTVLPESGRMPLHIHRAAYQDSLTSRIRIPADTISNGLNDYVMQLTRPLYALFDFFEPRRQIYDEELGRMRARG